MFTPNAPDHTPQPHTHEEVQANRPVGRCQSCILRVTSMLGRFEPYAQMLLLLVIRVMYGWFFVQTGWGKWGNRESVGAFFASLGLPMPAGMAILTACTELVGGLLLIAGLGTRLASAALAFVMLVALATAHADEAFTSLEAFTEQAPYPFLLATLLLLAFGPGRLSIDHFFRSKARACRVDWNKP